MIGVVPATGARPAVGRSASRCLALGWRHDPLPRGRALAAVPQLAFHVEGHDGGVDVLEPADAAAIRSPIESWRRRLQATAYERRGSSTLTSVCPSAAASSAISRAARTTRRSGHSTSSSGRRDMPEPHPAVLEGLGPGRVDGEVHGPDVVDVDDLGVLDGPRRGQVQRSTITRATWRGSGRASAAALGRGLAQDRRLLAVALVEPDQQEHQNREEDHDRPGPFGELGDREDDDDGERDHGRAPVDPCPVPPPRLPVGRSGASPSRPGHGEPGEHADGVHGHQLVHPGPGDRRAGAMETTARTMIPLENTSRWPRSA